MRDAVWENHSAHSLQPSPLVEALGSDEKRSERASVADDLVFVGYVFGPTIPSEWKSVLQSPCRDPIGPQPAQRGTCRRIHTYIRAYLLYVGMFQKDTLGRRGEHR